MPVVGRSTMAAYWSLARILHAHAWQTCLPRRYAYGTSEQAQRLCVVDSRAYL